MAWLQAAVRGVGQVVFLPGVASGLIVLGALAWANVWAALAGLAGSLLGAATARLLGRQVPEITAGLWGFNGALVAMAGEALGVLGWSLVAVPLTVPLAMLLTRLLAPRPTFTLPFIVVAMGLAALAPPALGGRLEEPTYLDVARGLSQIYLVNHPIAGLGVLLALAVHRPGWAVVAWIGALVGTNAWILGELVPPTLGQAWLGGLLGFNPALAALAVGVRHPGRLGLALLAALIATALTLAATTLPWPVFTLPFVLAAWCSEAIAHRFATPTPRSASKEAT